MNRKGFSWYRRPLALAGPPVLVLLGAVGLWQVAVTLLEVPPFVAPSPLRVAQTVGQTRGALVRAALLTGAAALAGLAVSTVVGSLVAFAFAQSRVIQRSLYPYAIFLQTVPVVAVAPLIILWFDTGFQSVVIVTFVIALFPIIANGTAGLTSVDPLLMELFAVNGASRWQVLWKLRLPNAIPYLVNGVRISSGLAVIGAIVGEFFAGYTTTNQGLGYLIIMAQSQLNTPLLFAAILSSTVLGLAIFGSVSLAGRRLVRNWHEEN